MTTLTKQKKIEELLKQRESITKNKDIDKLENDIENTIQIKEQKKI